LRTINAITKVYAAKELEKMGVNAKGAIIALIETLKDKEQLEVTHGNFKFGFTSPANCAVHALAKIGEPALEPLCHALINEDIYIRANASQALCELSDHYPALFLELDSSLIKLILDAYKDNKRYNIHCNVACIIAKLKDSISIELLISALNDSNICEEVIFALGKTNNRRVVYQLLDKLKNNKDKLIRIDIIRALGELRDSAAIEDIINILKDYQIRERSHDVFKDELVSSLQKITSMKLWSKNQWIQWWDDQKQKREK